MEIIGIKLRNQVSNAKVAKIMRKYEDISISEIKSRIDSDSFWF